MKHARLDEKSRGWFIGDFTPSVFLSKDFEVGIKQYRAGDREDIHHHRIAVKITVVVSGNVSMMGGIWGPGDIVVVEPYEATAFEALSDATTVVIKAPSALADKYPGAAPA